MLRDKGRLDFSEVNGSCFLHLADGRGWVFETKESHFVRIGRVIDGRFTFTFFLQWEKIQWECEEVRFCCTCSGTCSSIFAWS